MFHIGVIGAFGALPLPSLPISVPLINYSLDDNRLHLKGDIGTETFYSAPPGLVVLIVGDLVTGSDSAALVDDLCRLDPSLSKKIILAHNISGPQFTVRVIDELAGVAAHRVVQVVELTSALSQLRRELDICQSAFSALENSTRRRAEVEARLVLDLQPCGAAIDLQHSSAGISQSLPLNSSGLAEVGFHIASHDAGDAGTLEIVLTTLEDSQIRHHWSLVGVNLRVGWNYLRLPLSLEPDSLTPQLRISQLQTFACMLSLGPTHPNLYVKAANDVALTGVGKRVLALRASSAGPSLEFLPLFCKGGVESGLEVKWQLGFDQVRDHVHRSLPSNLVSLVFSGEMIQVHPGDGSETSIRLAGACPKFATRLECLVETIHALSGVVEYRVEVVEIGGMSAGSPTVLADSGWLPVSPCATQGISLFFSSTSPVSTDIVLSTRNPPGVSNSHSWATFRQFSGMCLLP